MKGEYERVVRGGVAGGEEGERGRDMKEKEEPVGGRDSNSELRCLQKSSIASCQHKQDVGPNVHLCSFFQGSTSIASNSSNFL